MDSAGLTTSPSGKADIAEGDILSPLKILDLTVEGGAIARHNGQVVFLDSGVVDEVVAAQVTRQRKKIINATVTEILKPSPHAISPWCPDFGLCGGCMWQHISLPAQYAWKEKRVGDTLARLGGISIPVAPLVTGEDKNFRTRMTYAFGEYEGRGVVGLRQKNSQQVIPLSGCGLQHAAADILQAVQHFLDTDPAMRVWQNNDSEQEGYWRFLTIHTPLAVHPETAHKQVVIELIVNKASKETHAKTCAFIEMLLEQGVISGGIVSQRSSRSTLAFGEKVLFEAGQTELFENYSCLPESQPAGNQPYLFSSLAFMQTNTVIFSKLLDRVSSLVPASVYDKVWDLYCGCGLIGQYLIEQNGSKGTSQLFGVDNDPKSIHYAATNAQSRNFAKTSYAVGAMDKLLRHAPFPPDLIILDPPRAGIDEKIIDIINESAASQLVYISCDVATQARDIKRLGEGWSYAKAYPFDMFPGTPHIENVVVLTRKP